MKTLHRILLVVGALLLTTQAHAVMYLARPYDPNLGRWISRDPIAESGGVNLYGFIDNRPLDHIDSFGFAPTPYTDHAVPQVGNTPPPLAGYTDANWQLNISQPKRTGDKWCITIDAQLKVSIVISNFAASDERGRGAVEHEREHERLYAKWYNDAIKRIAEVEGCYCSEECAYIAREGAAGVFMMNFHQAKALNVTLDMTSYPRLLNQSGRMSQYQQEYNAHYAAWHQYEALVKQKEQEWKNARCSKK